MRELLFIPLEDILVYEIICPPFSRTSFYQNKTKQKKNGLKVVKCLVRMSFLLLNNCPAIPLRIAIKDNGGLIWISSLPLL